MGGHQHQAGAFALGLPDGFGGLHPTGLGQLVFGQDDAVAALRISGHRHGHLPQLGTVKAFTGGEEVVAIHMEDDPVLLGLSVHGAASSPA